MTTNKLPFKLLYDKAVSEDAFKDQTHQKLANTLYDVILQNDEGMTIGLEGSWGSGKSTIVSMLKKKIDKNDNILYFYFDAWEHEGDPLRRIFLEELIEQFGSNNDYLKELQEEIVNDKKTVKVRTKRTPTLFGTSLAILSFFVPIGIAIVSGTIDEIVLYNTHDPHWKFIIGSILALIPFVPVLINFFYLLLKGKKLFDSRNWSFVLNTEDRDYEQEVYGDNERSSIEFENYFYKICHNIQSCNKKLVLVFDNLDRVNQSDSLKLWSTLQTFLQNRNPSVQKIEHNKNIWAIIPYDSEGLKELWTKNEKYYSREIEYAKNYPNAQLISGYTKNEAVAKSFFDKSFQIRLHVPHMILDNWEEYCEKLMNESLYSWTKNEIIDAINVLKWYRVNLIDAPTPREIKTYTNQVGILRASSDGRIDIQAICCFVYKKYLTNSTLKDIEYDLISGNFPDKKIKDLIGKESIESEISAILFNLNKEKAIQVLLAKPINKAFEDKNEEKIKDLHNTHKSSFWFVTKKILSDKTENQLISSSYIVKNFLMKLNELECQFFITKLTNEIPTWRDISFPDKSGFMHDKEDYFALRDLVFESGGPYQKLCELMGESFIKQSFDKNNNGFELMVVKEFTKYLSQDAKIVFSTSSFTYEKWKNFAVSADKSNIYLTNLFPFDETIVKLMVDEIIKDKIITYEVVSLVKYAMFCKVNNWDSLFNAIKNHGLGNVRQPHDYIPYYKIIKELSGAPDLVNNIIKLLRSATYFHLVYSFRNEKDIVNNSSYTLGKLIPNFKSISLSNRDINARNGLKLSIDWWQNFSEHNADYVWNEVKWNKDFSFIWKLAENPNNILILDIIWLARDENNLDFFNTGDVIQNYINSFKMISDDLDETNIAFAFCDNSNIENTIITNRLSENMIKENHKAFNALSGASNRKELHECLDPILDKYYEPMT